MRVEYKDGRVIVADTGGEIQMVLDNKKLKREQLPPRAKMVRRRMRWLRGSFLTVDEATTERYCIRMDIA